jgi:hypothetical protein
MGFSIFSTAYAIWAMGGNKFLPLNFLFAAPRCRFAAQNSHLLPRNFAVAAAGFVGTEQKIDLKAATPTGGR